MGKKLHKEFQTRTNEQEYIDIYIYMHHSQPKTQVFITELFTENTETHEKNTANAG